MPKNPDCACPRACPRHGDCEACVSFHKTRPNPPDCMRKSRRTARKAAGRCILVAGGPSGDRVGEEALSAAPGDLVIACDAGYPAALRLGLKPALAVGDFDSYGGEIAPDVEIVRTPVRKDDTDTMTGLRLGLGRGYGEFVIVGALGGRLDHTVANLQALCWLCTQSARGVILSADNRAWAVKDGALELPRMEGWYLSVFAAGECEGVTLRGVEYPLAGARLAPSMPIGVSNEFAADTARIEVARGTLIVIASRRETRVPDQNRTVPAGDAD